MNHFMTAKQVALDYFCGCVSYWKVLQMVKDDGLPYLLAGDRFLFDRTALDAWVAGRSRGVVKSGR